MTVYSKRCSAPTLPATAAPAEIPIPAWRSGSSAARRSCRSRPAASAAPAASANSVGAPNTHSAASPSNLLTQPPWRSTALHHELEEGVQQRDDLRGRPARRKPGGAHHVHEQHGHLAQLTAEVEVSLERGAGHVAAHVAAEEVAQALPFREARGHAVEARLEQPDLARVVHGHARLEVAGLHPADRVPDRPDRVRDRARGDQVRQEAHHEPGHGEEEGGQDSLALVEPRAGEVGDRERRDSHERNPRDEDPRHREPRGHAGGGGPYRRALCQGAGHDGPADPLREQVGDGACRGSAEQGDDHGGGRQVDRDRGVERAEEDRRQGPEGRGYACDGERLAHHQLALRGGRRPRRHEPALDRVADHPARPEVAEQQRRHHEHRERDQVHRQQPPLLPGGGRHRRYDAEGKCREPTEGVGGESRNGEPRSHRARQLGAGQVANPILRHAPSLPPQEGGRSRRVRRPRGRGGATGGHSAASCRA